MALPSFKALLGYGDRYVLARVQALDALLDSEYEITFPNGLKKIFNKFNYHDSEEWTNEKADELTIAINNFNEYEYESTPIEFKIDETMFILNCFFAEDGKAIDSHNGAVIWKVYNTLKNQFFYITSNDIGEHIPLTTEDADLISMHQENSAFIKYFDNLGKVNLQNHLRTLNPKSSEQLILIYGSQYLSIPLMLTRHSGHVDPPLRKNGNCRCF